MNTVLSTIQMMSTSGLVGELMNFTRTQQSYSKERIIYNADVATYSDFELAVTSLRDGAGVKLSPTLTQPQLDRVLPVYNWIINNRATITTDKTALITSLTTMFGDADTSFDVDSMVNFPTDTATVPNKLTITMVDLDIAIETWFVSTNYSTEYPDFDLDIFGPTPTIDDLISPASVLDSYIANNTLDEYNNAVNLSAATSPFTGLYSHQTTWVSTLNPLETRTIRFNFICYGPVLDNPEQLMVALKEYILSVTSHPESTWEIALPEVFLSVTFSMIPCWDKIALPNEIQDIYSPFAQSTQYIDLFKNHIRNLDGAYVDTNTDMLPTLWQSLIIAVCGSPTNGELGTQLSTIMTDYFLTSTGSADFIRMSRETQDFVIKLNQALPIAQNYQDGNQMPNGFTLDTVDNLTHICFSSYTIKLRILCKRDFLVINPPA